MNKIFLVFFFGCLVALSALAQEQQSWYGKLVLPGGELPLAFHIHYEKDSVYTLLESPMQGVKGYALSYTYVTLTEVQWKDKQFGLAYNGEIYKDSIVGVFSQNGYSLPMNLYPEYPEDKVEHKRPQHPQAPFPYISDTIVYKNPKDEVTIYGVFTYPKGMAGKQIPWVILVSGSGSQDVDGTVAGHKYFAVLADSLTRAGIGVFRFADRGVGESGGIPLKTTTALIAQDVLAAQKHLSQKYGSLLGKVGIVGHSQGGNVALQLAAEPKYKLDFIVLLAAPGQIGTALIAEQVRSIDALNHVATEETEAKINFSNHIYATLPKVWDSVTVAQALNKEAKRQYDQMPDSLKSVTTVADIHQELNAAYNHPAVMDLLFFDPIPYAKRVRCATLILNGDLDVQVKASTNTTALYEAIKNNTKVTVDRKIYPYLNHLFQYSVNGAIEEYELLEETINSEVLSDIIQFIYKQAL